MYFNKSVDQKRLVAKWAGLLDSTENNLEPVKESHKRVATAMMLEQMAAEGLTTSVNGGFIHEANLHESRKLAAERKALREAAPANSTGGFPNNPNLKGYDPILISMIRRMAPKLIAFDIAGVQPMTGPTGQIFTMKGRYTSQGGTEALHNEANTAFTGAGTHSTPLDPMTLTMAGVGTGMATVLAEDDIIPEMAFSIDKITVTAEERVLKAELTTELTDDLRAIHGLEAESILSEMMSTEILSEINRQFIRTVYATAVPGAQGAGFATPGEVDIDVDTDGRWSVEKFKGLHFILEKEANQIAKETRRGRGNFIICTSDVASALSVAGLLDCNSKLTDNLNVDDTGDTFVGVLNGRFKVYIDPYVVTNNFLVIGHKGASPMDAGIFYCPYIPLQMFHAIDPKKFQPNLAFKTRYGIKANPFSNLAGNSNGDLINNSNVYFRKMKITNL